MFHIADEQSILNGEVCDVYFQRSLEILESRKIRKHITVEFLAKRFPGNWPWAIFAGLEECMHVFERLNVNVWALPEGAVFHEGDPVMVIEGVYNDFGAYETTILGFLCQASGVATRATRCKIAADHRSVFSFGARRMHPAIAPMIERNAYIGGCDGVAAVKSAELLGIPPVGTIPHALILIMGDTVVAAEAFHEVIDPAVKRVVLVDTFRDEKFEAVRVAERLGKELFAVRLDTPGSRRGDYKAILSEIRWELDLRGHEHVKLFVSGGLNEDIIKDLNPVSDAYGVGTALSNAPSVDYSMDIIQIEDRPAAKRGKWSGRKETWQCAACLHTEVHPAGRPVTGKCNCGGKLSPILQQVIEGGKRKVQLPTPQTIREHVLASAEVLAVQGL